MISSLLRRQIRLDIEEFSIRIERIGKHGSATFYLWTHIEPSEGIHPTIESTPLTKNEILTRIELLQETYNLSLTDTDKFALNQLFSSIC